MKKFTTPEIEILKLEAGDIMTDSGNDLDWDILEIEE